MKNVVIQAELFAREKHKMQRRPNRSQQPITEHLAEVAELVLGAGGNSNEIAAAWLHDVLEDTDATRNDLIKIFNIEIVKLVDGLTDPLGYSDLPLNKRKIKQAERLKTQPKGVKLVKLCDQISNIYSVMIDPPTDWDSKKSLEYIQGANLIAKVCCGISDKLDKKFENLFHSSIKKYKY